MLAQSGFPTSPSTTEPDPVGNWLDDNGALAGGIVLVVAVLLGVLFTYGAYIRNKRQKDLPTVAQKHGLQFSEGDPFGSTKVAFPLFRLGDGREVSNVLWREGSNGFPVRVFDYSYFQEYEVDEGQPTIYTTQNPPRPKRVYHHFTCAMARPNGLWSPIRICRERAIDRVAQAVGLPDIELESEEFNRLFVVQCEDPKFATDLIDPQMMEFLIRTQGLMDFETKGRWLLVTTERIANAAELPGMIRIADEFCRRIPPVVWDLYPRAPEEDGFVPSEGIGSMPGGFLDLETAENEAAMRFIEQPLETDNPFIESDLADRRARRAREGSGTPKIEYDLDGNPITPRTEDPWA